MVAPTYANTMYKMQKIVLQLAQFPTWMSVSAIYVVTTQRSESGAASSPAKFEFYHFIF